MQSYSENNLVYRTQRTSWSSVQQIPCASPNQIHEFLWCSSRAVLNKTEKWNTFEEDRLIIIERNNGQVLLIIIGQTVLNKAKLLTNHINIRAPKIKGCILLSMLAHEFFILLHYIGEDETFDDVFTSFRVVAWSLIRFTEEFDWLPFFFFQWVQKAFKSNSL